MVSPRSSLALFAVVLGTAALGAAPEVVSVGSPRSPDSEATVTLSFFAIGDSGRTGLLHRGRKHVAEVLRHLDARQPAAALLLLGDFVDAGGGLDVEVPGDQVQEAIALPFGSFIGTPGAADAGRSIIGVMGNHDRGRAGRLDATGAVLQRWIPSWRGGDAPVESYRLAEGVDLVTYDSTVFDADVGRALTEALQATAGPWRIVAGHHPLRLDWETPFERHFADQLREAVYRAGVPVQLALAGHDHNLQIIDLAEPGLGLQVISGAGSRHRPVRGDLTDRWLGVDALGLVRIDRVDRSAGSVLRVTVYSLLSGPIPSAWPRPWPSLLRDEAVVEVDVRGNAHRVGA